MRLVLVGAGHVFEIGAPIRHIIHSERPRAVALELDNERYQGLLQRERGGQAPVHAKNVPRIYKGLAKFQEQVADSFGVQPGQEMLVAAHAAREIGAQVALIDRHAQTVIRDAFAQMGLRERLRFVWSAFMARFPSRRRTTDIEAEVQRYQQDPEHYLNELGKHFPTLKRVLIDERNTHMAKELQRLLESHETVVAVIGDGHVPGLLPLLAAQAPVVHRLKDLRRFVAPSSQVVWRREEGNARVGFSFPATSLESGLRRGP